jgi:hypothetical protein
MPYRADKDAAEQRVKVAQEELDRAHKALVHWYPGTPPKPLTWWRRAWLYVTRPFRRPQPPTFSEKLEEVMRRTSPTPMLYGASSGLLAAIHAHVGTDDKIRPPPSRTVALPVSTLSTVEIKGIQALFEEEADKEPEALITHGVRWIHTKKVQ